MPSIPGRTWGLYLDRSFCVVALHRGEQTLRKYERRNVNNTQNLLHQDYLKSGVFLNSIYQIFQV